MTSPDRAPLPPARLALVVGLVLAGAALGAGTAAGGDSVSALSFEPANATVAPGETVEVAVVMDSHTHDDAGVAAVTLRVAYHPEHVTVTGAEPGPWLDGPNTTVRSSATLDDERGLAVLEQRRDPPAGGAEGEAVLATLTVAVDDDAPPHTVELLAGDSEVELTSQYPSPVAATPGRLQVDGGGERYTPTVDPDATPTPTGTATATPTGTATPEPADDEGATGASADAPLAGAVAGLLAGLLVLLARRGG